LETIAIIQPNYYPKITEIELSMASQYHLIDAKPSHNARELQNNMSQFFYAS